MPRSTTAPARRAAWSVAATLLVAGLALTACGSDDGTEAATGSTTSTTAADSAGDGYGSPGGAGGADGAAATVVAKGFELSSTTAAAGAEVTFDNQDGTAHTLTADDGSFDTGPVAAGESATVTAPSAPGTYAFHCEIHPSMTGELTVEA